MSVRRRLEHLEARESERRAQLNERGLPVVVRRHLEALADWHRVEAGLPVAERPYTKEDREDDLDTLENTIPTFRSTLGWETEEAQALLDEWEHETRRNLQKGTER